MKLACDILKCVIAWALAFSVLILTVGCNGKWVWQEGYPKHRTMSFKCPRWNYDEAYDELHHIYTTKQHEPVKIKN
tara:strand:- start:366 stop:593 length:228 start_codon:yes stop_codon:yes gene_type:complete